jgi:hypothetical protein
VNKTNLCLTSLVAAIPGAWLAVLMVMAFLSPGAGGWSVVVKGLAGLQLLIGAALAAMPVGILVLSGPKGEKKSKQKDQPAPKGDEAKPQAAALADQEDDGFVSADATFEADSDPRDSEEFVETIGQGDVEISSDDFDLGADFELDSVEQVDPKKKKGK